MNKDQNPQPTNTEKHMTRKCKADKFSFSITLVGSFSLKKKKQPTEGDVYHILLS
jgi:hypothetical protein